MIKQLSVLILLATMNAQAMNENRSLSYSADSEKLEYAISINKFDSINNIFKKKNPPIDIDSLDKEILKKACFDNIKKNKLTHSLQLPMVRIFLGTLSAGLGSIFEYINWQDPSQTKEETRIRSYINTALITMGLSAIYMGATDYPEKQAFRNAAGIKELLIQNKVINENNAETEEV